MAGNGGAFRHIPSVRIDKIPMTKKKKNHNCICCVKVSTPKFFLLMKYFDKCCEVNTDNKSEKFEVLPRSPVVAIHYIFSQV